MSSIAARFTLILAGLNHAIGMVLARREPVSAVWLGTRVFISRPEIPRHAKLPVEIWRLLLNRLSRSAERLQALYDRWRAGTLPKPRNRPSRAATPCDAVLADAAPVPRAAPALRLPRARFWVIARIGYQAAGHASQLTHLFDEPDFTEFLAAAPQAGRILRPLCHMLGIAPPHGARLPPRPRSARPNPARPSPIPSTSPNRPLEPYVRAAVRAWKRKND